jgi:hypothetical protein
MVPTIRIDEDVFSALQARAQPFVDTPNTVLRRLLDLGITKGQANTEEDPGKARRASRARPGSILPHEAYVRPMLQAIVDSGGTAATSDVIQAVGHELRDRFTQLDRERLASGNIRWENRVQWVRLRLVERGMLEATSPRGVWAISDAGRQWLESDGFAFGQ